MGSRVRIVSSSAGVNDADGGAGHELPGGTRLPDRTHRRARKPERGSRQQRAGHVGQRKVQELGGIAAGKPDPQGRDKRHGNTQGRANPAR
jgi:hypothetical protein